MTTTFKCRLAFAALVISFGVAPRETAAQSVNQIGAWDGLVLSPVGALPPVAGDPGDMASGVNERPLALRPRRRRARQPRGDVVARPRNRESATFAHGRI